MTQDPAKQDADQGDVTAAFEQALADEPRIRYIFTLYVAGARSRSQRAIENIRRLCEEHLAGRYELQIIDIYQQPTLAQGAHIIAAPTLVKSIPPPLQRLIGLKDDGHLLVSLGIKVPGEPERPPKPSPRDPS